MFSLREKTKISCCRAAFFALCVAPTCGALAWCAAVHLPGYTRGHQRAIAAELGLHAQLAKASSPRPGTVLYESLELSDPETRQPLARFPRVEVRTTGGLVHVTLPAGAMINGTRLDAFWKVARETVRPTRAWRQVRFEAERMTVHLGGGDEHLTDLDGEIENTDDHASWKLRFHRTSAVGKPAEAAELTYLRNWQTRPPGGALQFTTGSAPLPCTLAASIWPGVERFGNQCEFRGRIFAPEQAGRWKTQFSGRFSRVDLGQLVGEQFPHKLTGLAEVEVERASIEDGRIETLGGRLTAGPGTVSGSLVQAAQTHLRLRSAAETRLPANDLVGYRQLAVVFALGARGLLLRGEAVGAPGAVLIDEAGGVLLREPTALSQSVVHLARMLVPQSDVQVPATRETVELIRALPVPSVASTPANQSPPAQARLPRVNPKRP